MASNHYPQTVNQTGYLEPPPAYGVWSTYSQTNNLVTVHAATTTFYVFRDSPVRTTCPTCQADIITDIDYHPNGTTWCWCCVCSFIGCCCIPFAINKCQDVVHTCPRCGNFIHRWKRNDD